MIKTVIIDPEKQNRERISALLSTQEDIEVLACGRDGYDALKLIGSMKPDIVIVSNQLEFIGGEELPPLIKTRSPSTAVIILVTKISDHQLYRAAIKKVSGIVQKERDMDIFPKILEWVSRGGCYISPWLAARVLDLFSEEGMRSHAETFPAKEDPAGYLNKTELRILTCIGEGLTSFETAENLGLAVGTVRNYVSSIMRKIGVQNRLQMVRYAYSYGLIQ
jgi:DNA-binding NarL/FixJ family response regulator